MSINFLQTLFLHKMPCCRNQPSYFRKNTACFSVFIIYPTNFEQNPHTCQTKTTANTLTLKSKEFQQEPLHGLHKLTPVLTSESMMRSLSASVSPPFILIRFLSRHFIAYLSKAKKQHYHTRY